MSLAELAPLAARCRQRLAWRRFAARAQAWSPLAPAVCALTAWLLRPLSALDVVLLVLLALAWLPPLYLLAGRRAPRGAAALAVLDRAAGLPDTFGSAWELADRDDPWVRRHQAAAAAERQRQEARLGELLPRPFPRQALLACIAALLVIGLPVLHQQTPGLEPERFDEGTAGELARLLEARGEELARLGEQHPEARPELEELAEELRQLRERLIDESREQRQVMAEIDRQAADIEDALGSGEQRQRATDALIEALAKHVDTAGLADALERGDAGQVAEAAGALAERLRQAGRKELARLAAALAEAAQVAGEAEADAAVKTAHEALARGDREAAARALEELGRRMESQARQEQLQQRLGSLAEELRQAGQQALRQGRGLRQVGRDGRSMASRALGANPFSRPSPDSLPAPSEGAMAGDGRPMPGQGQRPGQWGRVPGQTPIPGQMPGFGLGQGMGQGLSPVPGAQPGGDQAGWGSSDPGGGQAPETEVPGNVWAQAQGDGGTPGQTREVQGELRAERQQRGGRELAASALREAEAALALEDISPGRRRYLLRYFTALRSTIDEHVSQPDPLGDPGALDAIP